jgi:hypothetical protein
MNWLHIQREVKVATIREAVSLLNGKSPPLEDLCRALGTSPRQLFLLAKEGNTKLPYQGYMPKLDEKIDRGASLVEMLKGTEVKSRQHAHKYMHETDQHLEWKEKRKSIEEERNALTEIRKFTHDYFADSFNALIENEVANHARRGSYAYERAMKVIKKSPSGHYSPVFLAEFFKEYKRLKDSGIVLTQTQLGEMYGCSQNVISHILTKAEEVPLTWDTHRYSPEIKSKIPLLFEVFGTAPDIAYILQVPVHVVQRHAREHKVKIKGKTYAEKYGLVSITYRQAAEVFRLLDKGRNYVEVARQTGIERNMVKFIENLEKKIAPVIFKGLRIVYPRAEITGPYVPEKYLAQLRVA